MLLALVADFAHEYRLPLASAEAELGELLARNTRLRATLVVAVVGLLTAEEFAFYRQHRAELNRRLLDLVAERLASAG